MTTRLLPPDEWHRLEGTEAGPVWRSLNQALAHVLVVEDGDAIRGCWILLPVYHAECLYIAPEARGKASVGRRLLKGMAALARGAGIDRVWTSAGSDTVSQLLAHVGATKIPCDHYLLPLVGY